MSAPDFELRLEWRRGVEGHLRPPVACRRHQDVGSENINPSMSAPDFELSLEWRRGVEVHLRVAVELGGQKTSNVSAEGDSRQSVERLVDDVPGLCVQAHGVSWRCNAVPVTRIIGPPRSAGG